MAKNWSIKKDGVMTRVYKDDIIALTIKPAILFLEFNDMDKAQQGTIINGIKQKLDDSIARSKDMKLTEVEKREVQEALWERLSVERKWSIPKAATGPRGPSVNLSVIIPALQAAGFDNKKIAKTIEKPLSVVEAFITKQEEKEEKEAKAE